MCVSSSKPFVSVRPAQYLERYNTEFNWFNGVSVVIFTIEYLMRLWSCVEDPAVGQRGPVVGRLRFMVRFFSLVDLASILPWYIFLIPGLGNASFTTAVRGFRLIRVLKAEKYTKAFVLLGRVVYDNGALLIATTAYAVVILLIFSTILYYTERHNFDPSMECHYASVPAAMCTCAQCRFRVSVCLRLRLCVSACVRSHVAHILIDG